MHKRKLSMAVLYGLTILAVSLLVCGMAWLLNRENKPGETADPVKTIRPVQSVAVQDYTRQYCKNIKT
ncbi:hypothetical protein LJB83_01850 [Clostridia bacterium OttesenSCG-928-F22]|nr:hypothetical protein [Clostridia bacterium OttesenSCG-928-F22]